MSFFFLLIMILGHNFSWSQVSYVPPTKILTKKGHELGLSLDYFATSQRIDRYGREINLKKGEGFNRYQSTLSGFYGVTGNLQMGLGVRYRQNNSKQYNALTDEIESESSQGVESTFFHLMFSFRPVERFRYGLEGLFRFRPFTNEENGNLILGDDGVEYYTGGAATYEARGGNYLSLRVGYQRPGIHLSPEIYWDLQGAMVWNKFSFIAGLEGIRSLRQDLYEDDELDRPRVNTGSTLLYNSSNREFLTPYVGLNFSLGKHGRVELKLARVVEAKSSDEGQIFGLSFIRRVENEQELQAKNWKFKNYDFDANVTKVSPKKTYLSLDKGISSDIQKGMKIDIYEFDYVGGNILIASGVVMEVKTKTSVVKIINHYHPKKELKPGLLARGNYK